MRRTTVKAPDVSDRVAQQEPAAYTTAHRVSEEKHYTPQELARMWHFSPATIRNIFRNESGVLKLQGIGSSCGKRSYTTFSIPESVAARVHERLTQEPVRVQVPRREARRVVFVRDRQRRAA